MHGPGFPQKLQHQVMVLRGIRGVMRLLLREPDASKLLAGAARCLIEEGGFVSARVLYRTALGTELSAAAGSPFEGGGGGGQRGSPLEGGQRFEISIEPDPARGSGQSGLWLESQVRFEPEDIDALRDLSMDLGEALRNHEELAELRRREQHYRLLAENLNDVVSVFDVETQRPIYISPSVERLRGFTPEEALAQDISLSLAPESLAFVNSTIAERVAAFYQGQLDDAVDQLAFHCKDGSVVWTETSSRLTLDPDSGHLLIYTTCRDISDRKKLESREALLWEMSRMATVGGWEVDTVTGEAQWTPEVALIHELPADTEPTVSMGLGFYTPEARPVIEKALKEALERGQPYDLQLQIVGARGSHKWVRTVGHPVLVNGRVVKLKGMFQDITASKLAEAELRSQQARLEALLNAIPDLVWLKDAEGRCLECNVRFQHYLGASREDILGKTLDEVEAQPRCFDPFLTQDISQRVIDERWLTFPDGHRELVEVVEVPLYNLDGALSGVLGIGRDVTSRWQATDRLRESEERLSLLLEHVPGGVALFDRDMRYLAVSQRYLRDLGVNQDVIGRSHYEVFPEVPERWRNIHQRCLAGATEKVAEDSWMRADGKREWLRWELHPWRDAAREVSGLVLFMEDISERKTAEVEVKQSEERWRLALEAVGLGTFRHDLVTGMVDLDARARLHSGIDRSPVSFAELLASIHADDHMVVKRDMEAALAPTGSGRVSSEVRFVHPDGKQLWMSVHVRVISGDEGPQYALATIRDITHERESAAALRASEERFELAVRGSSAGLWDWDLKKDVLFFSPRFKAMLGYGEEDFPSLSARLETLHPDDRSLREQAMQAHLASGASVYDVEYRLLTRDGSYCWFHSRGEALRDEHGQPYRMAGSILDISERKSAEALLKQALGESRASSERFRLLANVTNDAIWDWDIRADKVWRSEGFQNLFGYGLEELDGKGETWANRIATGDRERVLSSFCALFREGGRAWSDEYHFLRRDGSAAYVLDRGHLIRDESGEPIRMIGGMTDLSERHARLQAEQANELKGQFLANMSHEIRTPLNAILGTAHLALTSDPSDRQRSYLEQIQRGGKALLRVVNDILDFSKVEAGRVELEEIELVLDEVIEDVLAVLALEARQKGLAMLVEVAPAVPPRLIGDVTRLGQILLNLLGNAIKFTQSGQVTLGVDLESESPDHIVLKFAVKDTGIGLTDEQIEGLFTAFSQADNSITRKYGGSGLGLALCRSLVELMEGRIAVESKPGKGSVFTFTARLARAAAGGDLQKLSRPERAELMFSDVRGARVLLVEDNATNQLIARELLERAGMHVEVADNGREALERVRAQPLENHWDIVLMDVQMPEMDGYSATAAIRRIPDFERLPIIALTAHVLADERTRCYQAGMNDYISKPIDPDELLATMHRWLGKSISPPAISPQGGTLSSAANPPDFPLVEGLHSAAGLKRVGGNEKLFRTLLLQLMRDREATLEALERAVGESDAAAVQSLAHALNGVSGNLGAVRVQEQAAELERLARQGICSKETLILLGQRFGELCEGIARVIAEVLPVTQGRAAGDLGRARQALQVLIEHLDRSDGAATQTLQEVVRELEPQGATQEQLERLTGAVEQFDFSAAAAHARELLQSLVSPNGHG